MLEREENILKRAFEALKENFDVQMKYSRDFDKEVDYQIDLRITLDVQDIRKKYNAEIKRRVLSSVIGQLLVKKREYDNVLLITEYVSPKIANKLRELEIPFIDASGNVYLSEPEFYIFVNTNSKVNNSRNSNPSLIFQTTGAKLLFALLSLPNSENRTYRELAEMSGISLGSVNDVMNALQTEHYLVKEKDKRILFRKDELLKRWIQTYSERLQPRLRTKEFLLPYDDWWEDIDLNNTGACWGGEVAASLMTGYLSPKEVMIYARGTAGNIIRKNKLRVQKDGDVKIVKKFWKFDEGSLIAPPILIYADLLATAKSRNIETAQVVYDEHISRLIE